jgi:hypothetical protein
MCHNHMRQGENRKYEHFSPGGPARIQQPTCGEPSSPFASHHLSVPWSIWHLCSHRDNTGLETTRRGLDLTCQ